MAATCGLSRQQSRPIVLDAANGTKGSTDPFVPKVQ